MKELIYKKQFTNKGIIQDIFLPTNKKWASTESKGLRIIESGEGGILFKNIIIIIEKAEEVICLQSFLIQDTEIINALLKAKIERNVRVFIMDSAEARLNNTGFEEDDSFVTKDYKKMLTEKFKNNFIHRQANNLHAKFILIDPKTNPQGYLFTGNFNKKPFFDNPELAVNLSKMQIKELFKVFVYHFWEYTTDEQTKNEQFDKVKAIQKFERPKLKNILVTSPDSKLSNLKNTLLESINKSETEIQFSTFGFDINHKLSQSILAKLKSGVKVTVFCRPREKAVNNNIDQLAKNGAEIYCHPLIHAKSLIVDNKEAFIFSANFEKHGMDTGFEIGTKLSKVQIIDLLKIYSNWESTFPFQFKHKALISETNKYFEFDKKGRVFPKEIKKEETSLNNQTIKRVEDLISFFTEIKAPKNYNSQIIEVSHIAQFQEIPNNYKLSKQIGKGVETVTYDQIIQKKTKKKPQKAKQVEAILITISKIKNENVPELIKLLQEGYKGINIFAKNEKN